MTPVLDQIDSEFQGRIKMCKIDTDQYPEVMEEYGVHAIPTLVFFKNGAQLGQITGVISKNELTDRLNTFLDSD